MKAVLVDHSGEPQILFPDSAITPNCRPWFVPDFGGQWVGNVYVAIRVNRLGKGVAPQFADRYVEVASVAVCPYPSDTSVVNATTCRMMDGAVLLGDWTELKSFPLKLNDINKPIEVSWNRVAQALSVCSRHSTMKTGDIILLPIDYEGVGLLSNTKLVAVDNTGKQIMSFNIK